MFQSDYTRTADYLKSLFGDAGGLLVIWRKSDKKTEWVPYPKDHEHAAKLIAAWTQARHDVYICMSLQHNPSQLNLPRTRGTAIGARAIGCIWADIDIRDVQAHKSASLPASEEEALVALGEFPAEPTAIVRSGHGLYALWCFREPWTFDNPDERERAEKLLRDFQAALRTVWTRHGWQLDATYDLARLLRPVGAVNFKVPSDPRPVTLTEHRGPRYNVSELEEIADSLEKTAPSGAGGTNPVAGVPGGIIPEGARNQTLTSIAGTLRRRGVEGPALEAALLAINHEQCKPPLPDDEVAAIAHSIAKYPAGAPIEGSQEKSARLRERVLSKLQDLPERAKSDKGAPFEVLSELVLLRRNEPGEYARLKDRLKKAGVSIRDLERAMRRREESISFYARFQNQDNTRVDAPLHTNENTQDTAENTEAESSEEKRDLPRIWAGNGDLAEMAEEAWAALVKSNDPPYLFQRGGLMTRILTDDYGRPYLSRVTEAGLRGILARCALWYTLSPDGNEEPAHPPLDVVRDMMAAPNMPLPVLLRVVEAPFFTTEGTLVMEPGYHPEARTWYEAPPEFNLPDVSAKPTREEVEQAKGLLLDELIGEFPFADDASRAHTLAAILLPYVRAMVDGPTPLHLIDAPQPGTGKGLLAETISLQATGYSAEIMAEGRDDDEWRKRITAALIKAPVFLLIDNVRGRLDSGALSAAITSSVWTDRMLGYSQMVTVPNNTVWIVTGNNVALSNEVSRRTVWIRLDAQVEQPWLRTGFKHPNLTEWTRKHRGELVWAALTLCQAWIAEGKPPGTRTLGSFEAWSRVIGGILDVIEVPGFLENTHELYSRSDQETQEWREFVLVWWDEYRDNPVQVRVLFELATTKSLIPSVLGDKGEHSGRIRLGKALARMCDRVISGYRIESAGQDHTGCLIYRLHPMQDGNAEVRGQTSALLRNICGNICAEKTSSTKTSGPSEEVRRSFPDPLYNSTNNINEDHDLNYLGISPRTGKTSANFCGEPEPRVAQGIEGAEVGAEVAQKSQNICATSAPGMASANDIEIEWEEGVV